MKIFKFIFIIILVFSTTLQANLINLNSVIKSDFSKDEIINAQDFILSNTYGLKFIESGAVFGKEFDAFRPDDHDFYSDYNPNAIGALEDNSLFFVPVGRIAQGASGTRYAMNGVTDISGSPVWQQIGKQGSLTEQYFVFANNAKQQITKPQILKNQPQSMVWDSAYRIGNIATDPRTWIYGTAGAQLANDVLNDSMPPDTYRGKLYYIYDHWDTFVDNLNLLKNKE